MSENQFRKSSMWSEEEKQKASGAQSVSDKKLKAIKTPVSPDFVSVWTLTHHHSASGALQTAAMLRGAGGETKMTLTAETFTVQTDSFTTAEKNAAEERWKLSRSFTHVLIWENWNESNIMSDSWFFWSLSFKSIHLSFSESKNLNPTCSLLLSSSQIHPS